LPLEKAGIVADEVAELQLFVQIVRAGNLSAAARAAARVQNLIDRNPVNTGRLHRDGTDSALLLPIGKRMQISCE
jgi:hypothetical protein